MPYIGFSVKRIRCTYKVLQDADCQPQQTNHTGLPPNPTKPIEQAGANDLFREVRSRESMLIDVNRQAHPRLNLRSVYLHPSELTVH
eukprot:scaffold331821_cov44-Prasinocladus_malaysianus.AAC.3